MSESKVILLGDQAVGKTAIFTRYVHNDYFEDGIPTIGATHQPKEVYVPGHGMVRMNLWDTAGQERFRAIVRMYYTEIVAAVMVYDVTDRKTFEAMEPWVAELREHTNSKKYVLALIGNKADDESNRVVNYEEGDTLKSKLKFDLFKETSAKENSNISEFFEELALKVYE